MKKTLLFLFLLIALSVSAQNTTHYKKVYAYDEFHKNWAMVKTITGTFGFIDQNGKEIVPAIYVKIEKFNDKKLAMVKTVAESYGFINEEGKEVIKATYFSKEEAIQKMKQYKG